MAVLIKSQKIQKSFTSGIKELKYELYKSDLYCIIKIWTPGEPLPMVHSGSEKYINKLWDSFIKGRR